MKFYGKLAATLLAAFALAVPAASGQGRKSLRINEVMVVNDSSMVDDFGNRSAWIEIYNPTAAAVNIASIYLTNSIGDSTLYHVPSGDAATLIGKGQTALFFADAKPNRGTFHLSFTLKPGQDNFIALFDADGKSLIDSVTVPASLPAGRSYARTPDGSGQWQIRTDADKASAITPGGLNNIKGPNTKIENFEKMDENGFAMSGMAMSIVFGALLVLCLCFIFIRVIAAAGKSSRQPPDATAPRPQPQPAATPDGEVAAAIAMALHQHLNMHDDINMRLTIKHNSGSAWTSKSALMRHAPNR